MFADKDTQIHVYGVDCFLERGYFLEGDLYEILEKKTFSDKILTEQQRKSVAYLHHFAWQMLLLQYLHDKGIIIWHKENG